VPPIRTIAAVQAGKLAGAGSRLLRRGGGTALPGLVAERVDPALVANLGRTLGRGRVLVTGTNGKTTTTRIIAEALSVAGVPFIHNREGSNLMRGIATSVLAAASVRGAIPHAGRTLGLFEADEATLPAATRALGPRLLVFTNLFRDQLDRYGEVDNVAALWREALAHASAGATLVLNADDPSVAELATAWGGPVHWFGLDDPALASAGLGASDARWCRCGGSYVYSRRYFAHIGWWRCDGCNRARPAAGTSATEVSVALDSASFTVPGLGRVEMPLTGIYNVQNALAAIAACRVLGLPGDVILRALHQVRAAFGRQEVVAVDGRNLRLLLAKNPAGADQVLLFLRALAPSLGRGLKVALLLNDRFADGQDVSWIWDVNHELLGGLIDSVWLGGDRAADLGVRTKYARWPEPRALEHSPAALLDAILRDTVPGDEIFVVPTYTAMLDFRAELLRRGVVAGAME